MIQITQPQGYTVCSHLCCPLASFHLFIYTLFLSHRFLGGSSANSFSLLKKNEEELTQLVRAKFTEAVEAEDVKAVERSV